MQTCGMEYNFELDEACGSTAGDRDRRRRGVRRGLVILALSHRKIRAAARGHD
jgi:hypothetical protein